MGLRLLWGVRGQSYTATVVVGALTASATTGALVAIGHRAGHAALPFAAIGAVLFPRDAGSGAVGLVFAGFVFHVLAMFVWSYVCVRLAERTGSRAFAAVTVTAGNFIASWVVAVTGGRGLASELTLGDRLLFSLVLGVSLVVGMRYAFFASRDAPTS